MTTHPSDDLSGCPVMTIDGEYREIWLGLVAGSNYPGWATAVRETGRYVGHLTVCDINLSIVVVSRPCSVHGGADFHSTVSGDGWTIHYDGQLDTKFEGDKKALDRDFLVLRMVDRPWPKTLG